MAEYIERETAKAKIREKFKFVPARIEINEVLNSIPAADVRPVVRGKWENTGSDVWKCSACGYGIMPWNAGVNFCPNCGAKMQNSLEKVEANSKKSLGKVEGF